MTVFRSTNVEIASHGATPMILARGYGCDQHMWRMVAPSFEKADSTFVANTTAFLVGLQWADDSSETLADGEWLNRSLERSELVVMKATGLCPHLSAPAETIVVMGEFLAAINFSKELTS